MVNFRLSLCSIAVAAVSLSSADAVIADPIGEALAQGTASGNFRLRYEAVDQDNTLDKASALTLRSRIGYRTGTVNGFSAFMEFEDSRVVGARDDYNNTLGEGTDYSVVADPEVTEVDQAYLRYQGQGVTVTLGRQVLTMDNHRFVGHVGWRQDRQTFDGTTIRYVPVEGVSLMYGHINNRNRIFGEEKDIQSKDNLFNAAWKTPVGTLSGYHYGLEVDDDTDNALDTTGLRFAGGVPIGEAKLLYTLEYATQNADTEGGDFDAQYVAVEAGVTVSGITAKVGVESLGSDEGDYGFSTPLATLHKFNGWADQFLATPNTGLVDTYVTLASPVGPGKIAVAYHDYRADEDTDTIDDFGREWNVSYGMSFSKHYFAGVKYAAYQKGDDDTGKVDTDKVWAWVGAKF